MERKWTGKAERIWAWRAERKQEEEEEKPKERCGRTKRWQTRK